MKKILIAIMLLGLAGQAQASGVLGQQTVFVQNDVLKADNPTWTGIHYNGNPVLWAIDGIGFNINYITQIVTTPSQAGGRVTITLPNLGSVAYASTFSSYGNRALNTLGISTVTFQDSGIIIPTPSLKEPGFSQFQLQTGNKRLANGSVTAQFELSLTEYALFTSGISTWSSLFTSTIVGTQTFYKR